MWEINKVPCLSVFHFFVYVNVSLGYIRYTYDSVVLYFYICLMSKTGTIPASRIVKPLWRPTCRSAPVLLNDTTTHCCHAWLPPAAERLASPNHTAAKVLWRYHFSLYRVHWFEHIPKLKDDMFFLINDPNRSISHYPIWPTVPAIFILTN